jgi:hypothetical protein
LPTIEPVHEATTRVNNVPRWNCSIRGWVRAPDLAPDMHTQADARLVFDHGEDCRDVRRWAVGLRLFERSMVKFR